MPEVSRFFGIVIRMHWSDHNPPHIHAYYGDCKAVFSIETGEKMKGNFPKIACNIIEEWTKKYQKQLLNNWETMKKEKIFRKIKGADR